MQTNDADAASETGKSEPDRQKPPVFCRLKEWSEMVKIEHTVFALPFALSGLLLGCRCLPPLATWCWTIIAFASARAAAMTLNRLIDARIDALNPRTRERAIPAGRISSGNAIFFVVLSFALMIFAASKLPLLCLLLSPVAVFWLSFYSYTKRITWLCHIALGVALGGAALGGWIAAGGRLTVIDPWLLAVAVTTWVAGFDIIYALQDVEFDRKENLHSIPARFGIEKALTFSSALHLITACALVLLGALMNLGTPYWAGVAIVIIMLKYEHSLVRPDDLSKVNAAFFNINGLVSIAIFLAILLDRLI